MEHLPSSNSVLPASPPPSPNRSVEKVVAALSKAQGEFKTLKKTKEAEIRTREKGTYRYSYVSLDDVMEMVRPVLCAHELAITHAASHEEDGWMLTTRLYHESGQYLESVLPLGGISSPQELGSKMSYMRRYGACALLGVVSEEDDDGEGAEAVATESRRRKRAAEQPKGRDRPPATSPAGQPDAATKPRRKKAEEDPKSKAGDGTPSKNASLSTIWPQVYRTAEALGLERKDAVKWFREFLEDLKLPASTKDLRQSQANMVLQKLHDLEQQNTPPPSDADEPPPPGDDDASAQEEN